MIEKIFKRKIKVQFKEYLKDSSWNPLVWKSEDGIEFRTREFTFNDMPYIKKNLRERYDIAVSLNKADILKKSFLEDKLWIVI